MEVQPGDEAPTTGVYEKLNVFGTSTGEVAVVAIGEKMPRAARGFTWRKLSDQSPAELRARATEYRRMADAARTQSVMDSLRRLADRFDRLADLQEWEEET